MIGLLAGRTLLLGLFYLQSQCYLSKIVTLPVEFDASSRAGILNDRYLVPR